MSDIQEFDEVTVGKASFARVLLVGPSKQGKSTCIALTAPKPYILNCDGVDALQPATRYGAKFRGAHVTSMKAWKEGIDRAIELAEKGEISTIVVDTLTLLCNTVLDECKAKWPRGYESWNHRDEAIMSGMIKLFQAPAHLITVCHLDPKSNGIAGILPVIAGQDLPRRLPPMHSDWVLFQVNPSSKPERYLVLGAQGDWTASGRHIDGANVVEADFGALFESMGFAPPA